MPLSAINEVELIFYLATAMFNELLEPKKPIYEGIALRLLAFFASFFPDFMLELLEAQPQGSGQLLVALTRLLSVEDLPLR